MWVVFKYKSREYNVLQEDLKKRTNNEIKFYNPKIKYCKQIRNKQKEFVRYILENYAFCFEGKIFEFY